MTGSCWGAPVGDLDSAATGRSERRCPRCHACWRTACAAPNTLAETRACFVYSDWDVCLLGYGHVTRSCRRRGTATAGEVSRLRGKVSSAERLGTVVDDPRPRRRQPNTCHDHNHWAETEAAWKPPLCVRKLSLNPLFRTTMWSGQPHGRLCRHVEAPVVLGPNPLFGSATALMSASLSAAT